MSFLSFFLVSIVLRLDFFFLFGVRNVIAADALNKYECFIYIWTNALISVVINKTLRPFCHPVFFPSEKYLRSFWVLYLIVCWRSFLFRCICLEISRFLLSTIQILLAMFPLSLSSYNPAFFPINDSFLWKETCSGEFLWNNLYIRRIRYSLGKDQLLPRFSLIHDLFHFILWKIIHTYITLRNLFKIQNICIHCGGLTYFEVIHSSD